MNSQLHDTAASVRTVEDFKQWTKTVVRPLLPHEALICGLGHLHAGGVGLDYLVTVDYPLEHLQDIRNRVGEIDTPILRRWLAVREPLIFEAHDPWPGTPQKWLDSFRRHDLRNIVVHALADTERCVGTYHSFSRIPGTPGLRHIEVLQRLVPVLHDVLCRVIENHPLEDRFTERLAALTEGERKILQWVGLGKPNAGIATLAGMSENTVKHHLTNIFGKLGTPNRAQLVRRLAEHESRQQASGTKVL